jgi:hypothetical protein
MDKHILIAADDVQRVSFSRSLDSQRLMLQIDEHKIHNHHCDGRDKRIDKQRTIIPTKATNVANTREMILQESET